MMTALLETQSADPIIAALDEERHVLPDQGPLGVFIHHNTLHAFQHLTFHEAVQRGAELIGARPYLDLHEYRAAFHRGRIDAFDLERAIVRALGARSSDAAPLGMTRLQFTRYLLLEDPVTPDTSGERFRLTVGDAPESDRLLMASCRRAAERHGPNDDIDARPFQRHRDIILALGGHDIDLTVMRELVRLSSAFLDHGQAMTAMPHRELGFLSAVTTLYASGASEPRGAPGIRSTFRSIAAAQTGAISVIKEAFDALQVSPDDRPQYLSRAVAALPGWAGMFARMEAHPEESGYPCSLAEFVAVRLVLERHAVEHELASLGSPMNLAALTAALPSNIAERRDADAIRLFYLARHAQLSVAQIESLNQAQFDEIWSALHGDPTPLARRAIWHEAYEGWYRRHTLDALIARRDAGLLRLMPGRRPAAQFVFCIDEREEAIHRALEEQSTEFETFGAAGFFGIAIDYQGLYDAEPAAHCPVVVTPAHEVFEAPIYTSQGWHNFRQQLRMWWNRMHRGTHHGSRTLLGGALLSLVLGPMAAIAALVRVFMPRRSLIALGHVADRLFPLPSTRLTTLRDTADVRSDRGKQIGFSLDEAADRVGNTLKAMGLVSNFAPVVIVLGHGSTSLNNPHESAHDCGACGGRRGGANARLFADLANRRDIRAALERRGVIVPSDTWFIGGLHDTADDGVHYHDLALLPEANVAAFERADHALQVARELSAQERCRRFEDAPLDITPADALQHVEARARHLGQPRPEYGHCTNAIAIVGRRELSRGIHYDRRTFLISYDPTIDPDATILERILAAVGPVGAGISLEYYFSSVDNDVYGCGTKLPHNVTGLIAVMNGHLSDLRTGLPIQMVEIHEPMRLLLIVENTPEALLTIAGKQAEVRELVVNGWVQLVSVDPVTGAMQVFEDGTFVPYQSSGLIPPTVARSADWHSRTRAHVTPALIEAPFGDALHA